MKVTIILLTLYMAIVLSSCKKNVIEISPEYEGEWHSEIIVDVDGINRENYLIIDENHGEFGQICELDPLGNNCFNTFSGDVKFNFNKSKIYIGSLLERAVLRIDEPAHINSDGRWECKITGHVYLRN